MFTVYILYSASLDCYYIGSTSNMSERLRRHLSNHKGYTNKAKDWVVVYVELFEEKSKAEFREQQLKSWKSRKLIEQLVNSAGSAHSD